MFVCVSVSAVPQVANPNGHPSPSDHKPVKSSSVKEEHKVLDSLTIHTSVTTPDSVNQIDSVIKMLTNGKAE